MNTLGNQPNTNNNSRFYYGYVIAIACFIIIAVNAGIFLTFGVFFKPILNEFGWTRAVTSGPISVSIVISGLLGIVMGGFTDKFGPRMVIIGCGVIAGAGYILMSQISNVWQLYVYYGLLTATGISILVPIMSTVARWFVKNRTLMTGIIVSAGGVGGFIMPMVADWLISNYNWRLSYIVLGIAMLVIDVIAALFLKRNPPPQLKHHLPEIAIEQKSEGYSFKESVSTVYFWIIAAAFICFSFTSGIIQIHIVPHVTDINFSTTTAASVLSVMNALNIVGAILLGTLADRAGNRNLFIITLLLSAIAILWLIFIQQLWMLYIFAVIFGIAWGSATAQQSPLVASVFGMKSHGMVLGLMSFINTIGVSLGGFLAGYVFDINGSYHLIFVVAGILCFIGLILMVFIKPVKAHTKNLAIPSEN